MECIHLRPVEEVPADACVYDYDQLPDRLRLRLPRSVDPKPKAPMSVCLPAVDDGPGADDYVRYTEYYHISRS